MSGMIAIEIDPAGHTVVERRSDQIDALGIGDSRPEPVACVGQQGGIFRIHDKPCFKPVVRIGPQLSAELDLLDDILLWLFAYTANRLETKRSNLRNLSDSSLPKHRSLLVEQIHTRVCGNVDLCDVFPLLHIRRHAVLECQCGMGCSMAGRYGMSGPEFISSRFDMACCQSLFIGRSGDGSCRTDVLRRRTARGTVHAAVLRHDRSFASELVAGSCR